MEKTLRIALKNKYGLHVRPSTALAKLASASRSELTVALDGGEPVDTKNVMSLLTMGAVCGASLNFRAVGEDAEDTIEKVRELVDGRFGGIE